MRLSKELLESIFLHKLTQDRDCHLPLRYQISEFDCGPTSVLNALTYLFSRRELSPELIRNITLYTLDTYKDGVMGKAGTSHAAMMFLAHWMNGYAKETNFPIHAKYYRAKSVYLGSESNITDALRRGGVAVVRLFLDEWHYVLLTGIHEDEVYLFDPYYWEEDFQQLELSIDLNHPTLFNRIVHKERLNQTQHYLYAFGEYEMREALVLFNEERTIKDVDSIEYFI